jgi:CheY-like chemotaxis protein
VLVVDDDEFNRLVLRRYLPTPPLTLAMAVNGHAALEQAEREWPDVVLLDLEMPVMDGYEAAKRLREMERAPPEGRKRCLIVAISSNDDEAIVQRALAAGCDHYLVKPAPRDVLWRLLAGVPDLPAAQRGAAAPSGEADAVLLDPDLASMVEGFLETRRRFLAEMQEALAQDDRPALKRLAHKVAGGFAMYGFAWAATHCRTMERDALLGDAADLGRRLEAVRRHLGGVQIRYRNAGNMEGE